MGAADGMLLGESSPSSEDEESADERTQLVVRRKPAHSAWPRPASRLLERTELPLCICGWYCSSVALVLFNKWVLTGRVRLPCPLMVTTMHIGMKVPLAMLCMRHLGIKPLTFGSYGSWCFSIGPCGLAAALDIGLSNLSFLYVSVVTYTICKASTPVWILLMSICLGLQRPRPALVLVIAAVAMGIALAAVKPGTALDDGAWVARLLQLDEGGGESLHAAAALHVDVA